jgi:hypothetical protein
MVDECTFSVRPFVVKISRKYQYLHPRESACANFCGPGRDTVNKVELACIRIRYSTDGTLEFPNAKRTIDTYVKRGIILIALQSVGRAVSSRCFRVFQCYCNSPKNVGFGALAVVIMNISILGYNAAESEPMFRRKILPPSSESKNKPSNQPA